MICLILRSQHLCFAVARIFARCVRARTARERIRRIFDRVPPRYPAGKRQAHGALYGFFPGASFRGSAFCISNGLGPVESV